MKTEAQNGPNPTTWRGYAAMVMELFRYVWSTLLLLVSLGIILYAQATGNIVFYDAGLPNWATTVLFVVFISILGMMEGTMIAVTQLRSVDPETYCSSHPHAYHAAQFVYQGLRVERFLNGRQVFVVVCGFQLARLTTPTSLPQVGTFMELLLDTGLLGSFVVCILGQLTPQIFAAKFPVEFLNLRFPLVVVRVCLAVEFTGVTYACWAIARTIARAARAPWDAQPEPATTRTIPAAEGDGAPTEMVPASKPDHGAHFRRLRLWLDHIISTGNSALPTSTPTADLRADGPCRGQEGTSGALLSVQDTNEPSLPILVGGRLYASPASLRKGMEERGLWQLSFLREDALHVPPHIAAAALYAEVARLRADASATDSN